MMKWFRKHNKQLLAVFASALLVVWLGGTAFERMFQPNPLKQPIGTAFNRKVTVGDLQGLRTRLDLLASMGIPWQVPWRNPWIMTQLQLPEHVQQDPILTAGARPLTDNRGQTDWWLLDQEARRMGVSVSLEDVKQFIQRSGIPGDRLTAIRDHMNVSTDDLLDTIAEYLRVSYAAILASAAVQVTEPEIKDLYVRTNDQVSIRYVLLPSQAFEPAKDSAAASQPVPEAELQELFNQYKDNLPGAGKYGFGYRIPDRVSIQYVGATVDDLVRTLPPVSEDRARKYFEQYKEKFQPPRPPTTQATSQPVVKFEEVKDRVIEQIQRNDATALLREVMEGVRAAAFGEYTACKAELDAGRVPDGLRNVLEERRNELSAVRKLPLVYRQTGLVSREDAAKEPGIGSASAPGAQGQRISFAEYAFHLERAGATPERQSDEAVTKIKMWQPVTVRDEVGDQLRAMYVFRVVGEEPSHAPALLSEVKDQVERDARTLQAYRKAQAAAERLAAAARTVGLKAAFAEQYPALATRPVTTRPTTRPAIPEVEMFEQDSVTRARAIPAYFIYFSTSLTFPTRLVGIQDADPVLKASFALADAVAATPSAASQAAASQSTGDQAAGQSAAGPAAASQRATGESAASPPVNRVDLVELPEQKAWAVVEVIDRKPANEPDFAKAKMDLLAGIRIQKLRTFYAAWYDPDMIEKRARWQSAGTIE
jgi:hypothetical protein